MEIQFRLIGRELNHEKLIDGMVKAFHGDLNHKCTGRSAPDHLERAVQQVDAFSLAATKLREIYARREQASVK